MAQVRFETTPAEAKLISKIADRAIEIVGKISGATPDKLDIQMDLSAAHSNGCPIDFKKLLAADDFNLLHDVSGIGSHLNRKTGKLMNHFSPRCSLKQAA